ncbi:hypothetical protein FWH13_04085 [Candidatus Saccharibacteria bacterium]|nr:hypothetical protein [Candidatus Saccharibacteria bacterium]
MLEEFIAKGVTEVRINPPRVRVREGRRLVAYEFGGWDLEAELLELAAKTKINPAKEVPQTGSFSQHERKIEVSYMPTLAGGAWALEISDLSQPIPSLAELGVPVRKRTVIWKTAEEGRGLIIAPPPVLFKVADELDVEVQTIEDRPRYRLKNADQYIIRKDYATLAPRALLVAVRRQPEALLITRLDSRRLAELACDYAAKRLVLASVPARVKDAEEYLAYLGVPEFLLKHILKVSVDAASLL